MLNRRSFLKLAAGAPAVLGQAQRRPNVVVIVADEWRAQSTGYGGDRNVRTPVLDRMAAESVNFETAVSGCPVCCPYRASLMTGQYPLTNGVFINDVELKPNGPTLGEAFRSAGYATGFIGKWHLYGSPDGKYGRRLAYIPPEKRFGFDYWKACECTHEYNHSLYYEGTDPTPKYWPGYDAFAQTDDACAFIEHHRDPFFLMLSLGPPHFPYATAPERYQEMYRDKTIQLRPNVPPDKKQQATEILRGYYAHMTAVDDCLDRILRTLEKTGIAEDTIVVFTSDHGDMMLSQGLTTKLYPWDESIRVPLLIRYPRKFGRKSRRETDADQFTGPDADSAGTRRDRDSRFRGGVRFLPRPGSVRVHQSSRPDHRGQALRLRRVSRPAHGALHLRAVHQRSLAAVRQPARSVPDAQPVREEHGTAVTTGSDSRRSSAKEKRRVPAGRGICEAGGGRALPGSQHARGPPPEPVGRLGFHTEIMNTA